MDQIKIGKFINSKRKEINITQSKLAEMLGITDRAISKWENGICMPDAGTIPELCEILNITINDLFSGEVIDMKEYDKKAEENLLEMAKKEESNNKKVLFSMYAILITSITFYFTTLLITVFFVPEGITQTVIILAFTILLCIAGHIALKLEVEAGYYECKNCHHKFVPSYKEVFFATHMGTIRKLKCPKCHRKSWTKKVLKK